MNFPIEDVVPIPASYVSLTDITPILNTRNPWRLWEENMSSPGPSGPRDIEAWMCVASIVCHVTSHVCWENLPVPCKVANVLSLQ